MLKRPQVGLGLVAVVLVFGGHFAFFTYLRPFLETVTGVDGAVLSAMLLVLGYLVGAAGMIRRLRQASPGDAAVRAA